MLSESSLSSLWPIKNPSPLWLRRLDQISIPTSFRPSVPSSVKVFSKIDNIVKLSVKFRFFFTKVEPLTGATSFNKAQVHKCRKICSNIFVIWKWKVSLTHIFLFNFLSWHYSIAFKCKISKFDGRIGCSRRSNATQCTYIHTYLHICVHMHMYICKSVHGRCRQSVLLLLLKLHAPSTSSNPHIASCLLLFLFTIITYIRITCWWQFAQQCNVIQVQSKAIFAYALPRATYLTCFCNK